MTLELLHLQPVDIRKAIARERVSLAGDSNLDDVFTGAQPFISALASPHGSRGVKVQAVLARPVNEYLGDSAVGSARIYVSDRVALESERDGCTRNVRIADRMLTGIRELCIACSCRVQIDPRIRVVVSAGWNDCPGLGFGI